MWNTIILVILFIITGCSIYYIDKLFVNVNVNVNVVNQMMIQYIIVVLCAKMQNNYLFNVNFY